MIVIQTTIDHRAMTALARMTRKTMRRGRNGPVRVLAWFAVLLEGYLTAIYLRAGVGGWHVNALLGGIGLRRTPPDSREVNTAFQEKESCYICRAQSGERWWLYSQVAAAVETKDYFALLLDRKQGQVFDKRGLTWGTMEELRELIRKKTGLKIQHVR